MNLVFKADLDGEREVFVVCPQLDWFVKSEPSAAVCVTEVRNNGDQHQSIVTKDRLENIQLASHDDSFYRLY